MNTTISSSLNYKFGFMAFAALLLALPFWQPQLAAAEEPLVIFGPSDADSIALLNGITGFRNRFWWNHTNLTVAVSAAPNVDPLLVEAIHDAIGTWRTVLASRLPIVSLTDVTDTARIQQRADVVVHYVPKAGGIRFTGVANCGVQNCLNLMVRSDLLDHNDRAWPDFDPLRQDPRFPQLVGAEGVFVVLVWEARTPSAATWRR